MRIPTGISVILLTAGIAGCGSTAAPSPVPGPPSGPPSQGAQALAGWVFDTAFRPLPGATIEVLDGPQAGTSVTASAQGHFSLPGTFDAATRFRASREAHVAETRTGLEFSPDGPRNLIFYLTAMDPPVDVAGDYQLTLVAAASCDLPEPARSRSYAATITPRSLPYRPDNTLFDATVGGATLHGSYWAFPIGVTGSYMAVEIGEEGPLLVEDVAPNMYVAFEGRSEASIAAARVSSISMSFQGSIDRLRPDLTNGPVVQLLRAIGGAGPLQLERPSADPDAPVTQDANSTRLAGTDAALLSFIRRAHHRPAIPTGWSAGPDRSSDRRRHGQPGRRPRRGGGPHQFPGPDWRPRPRHHGSEGPIPFCGPASRPLRSRHRTQWFHSPPRSGRSSWRGRHRRESRLSFIWRASRNWLWSSRIRAPTHGTPGLALTTVPTISRRSRRVGSACSISSGPLPASRRPRRRAASSTTSPRSAPAPTRTCSSSTARTSPARATASRDPSPASTSSRRSRSSPSARPPSSATSRARSSTSSPGREASGFSTTRRTTGRRPALTSQPVRAASCRRHRRESGYERARYRDFTTNLGGPAIRDRLWFFAGYQYLRDYDSQPGTDPRFPRTYEQDKIFAKLTWRLAPGWQLMQSLHDEFWVNPEPPTYRHAVRSHAAPQRVGAGDDLRPPDAHALGEHGLGCSRRPVRLRAGRTTRAPGSDDAEPVRPRHGRHQRRAAAVRRADAHSHDGESDPHPLSCRPAGAPITSGRWASQFEKGEHRAPNRHSDRREIRRQQRRSRFRRSRARPSNIGGMFITAAAFVSDAITVGDRLTINAGLRFDHSRAISQDLHALDAQGRETDQIVEGLGHAVHLEHVVAAARRHREARPPTAARCCGRATDGSARAC